MATRRSCDRCYKKKERCTFEPHTGKCTQCVQSNSPCTSLRSRNRPGRKPKATAFGKYGSLHVWDAAGGSNTQSHKLDACPTPSSTSSLTSSQKSPDEIDNEAESSRTFEGGELVPGPRHYQREEGFSVLWRRELGISLEQLYDLQNSSLEFFYATNDIFMLGPGFADQFLTTLRQCYEFAPGFLRDTYQAMFTALIWARHQATSFDQVDISRGALSLRRLRTFSVCNLRDAVAAVSLGPTLAAFDVLTRCVGSVIILRHSLSMVQAWYPTLSNSPGLDPIIIAPIFWDTAHCLILREIPIIRYLVRDPHTVDRVAGMCTTLLPILYDLCVASNKLRRSGEVQHVRTIREVENKIIAWRPDFGPELHRSFSKREILAMTAQASMYRAAALLTIHRLFNLIGTADDIAKAYATEIVAKLHEHLVSLGQEEKLQHTALPMFLAALELPNLAQETWTRLSLLKAPSICLKKLAAVVEFVWEQRSSGFSGSLFDLLEAGPEFVVIP
ncbi:uncharacterized protein Z519_06459 [Cladophialophora bantiana CBS 173.52]|uniref:Zn(2)-C6 fungal-type domain-containing protein n=1 Tax=Cladophialophora bantiana (strain ATCC 10958 / CBS 173.52 / CDC B-1940 / NIH 8579) TaxID=1442370 RepID=A0A0D2G1K5_CLAB1|nr:uncharacterized protein Z519_06459 [Cladophialophora bantiana CBS 173.52]KIW92612.1 hypothetical protein Z519_06459 [Cladophialophora bantiana CBS 173.52]